MEDEDIIELYFDRNQDAIKETDKKYGKYCHTIANNILYSSEDSEECVNDTYLNTWNTIPPERPSILKAFLGKITRNLAINMYKKNHAKKRYDGIDVAIDELEEVIPDDFDLEKMVEAGELSSALNDFLSSVSEEKRKILVERYWYIYPVKDIANKYDISESKVKMTLSRAREEMKEFLEKRGVLA